MKTKNQILLFAIIFIASFNLKSQVPGILLTSQENILFSNYKEFDKVQILYEFDSKNDCILQQNFGAPELPVVQKKFLLPLDASNISIQITNTSLHEFPDTYYIVPEQMPIPLDGSEPPDWISPKAEIYESDNPYPEEIIELYNEESTMGYKIVAINIFPLSYRPLSQTLSYYSNIEFLIQYDSDLKVNLWQLKHRTNLAA